MNNTKQWSNCLICGAAINECHLGVDSCSACAVFYRRIQSSNKQPAQCRIGDGNCWERDNGTNCRKCRFDRFTEVLNNAKSEDIFEEMGFVDDEYSPKILKEEIRTTFVDHRSFLHVMPSSSSDTPVLDGIRWGYSLLCQTRKSGELATKPVDFHFKQGDFDGSDIQFHPVTYSVVVPNSRILLSALFDFGNMAFPEFGALSGENKGRCIMKSFFLLNLVDSNYRTAHYFPDDPTKCLASYTTTYDEESLKHHFDIVPEGSNVEEARELLRAGIQRSQSMCRGFYDRIHPDDEEFMAIFGLAFWNNEIVTLNEEIAEATERSRASILKELNVLYKKRGMNDYASRLGQLLCYLQNAEKDVSLIMEEMEMYRLLNFFNEAYKFGRTFSEIDLSHLTNEEK